MSIINQTLRELDARKTDSPASRMPLPPEAAASPRRPGPWAAGAMLLALAGLLGWFVSRPGGTAPPARPAAPLVASQAAIPAQATPRPAAAVSPQAPAEPGPAAAGPVVPRDTESRVENPVPGKAAPLSSLSLRMQLSPLAEPSPLIRKEADKPDAEDEADERYRKAVALMQKGRENQARPLLEEALRLSARHAAARQMLATLLSEAGQSREAEAVLREGRIAAPDNAWFALGLARLQAARGDTEGAVATLQDGVEGQGVNAEYRATLAALLVRLKQHAEAARQYQQALKLQPEMGIWWLGLAVSLEEQGKTSEARSAYGRALGTGNLPEKLAAFARTKVTE